MIAQNLNGPRVENFNAGTYNFALQLYLQRKQFVQRLRCRARGRRKSLLNDEDNGNYNCRSNLHSGLVSHDRHLHAVAFDMEYLGKTSRRVATVKVTRVKQFLLLPVPPDIPSFLLIRSDTFHTEQGIVIKRVPLDHDWLKRWTRYRDTRDVERTCEKPGVSSTRGEKKKRITSYQPAW